MLDKILRDIKEQKFIAITQDSEYDSEVIHRLEVEGLIYEKNQPLVYWLTANGYKAIEIGGFAEWKKDVENKEKVLSKSLSIIGNVSITDSKVNLFSDNSSVSSPNEALIQLENMIHLINENQKLDFHFKEKLLNMNSELQSMINTSKENKLPILDNVVSLTSNFVSLFSSFFPGILNNPS